MIRGLLPFSFMISSSQGSPKEGEVLSLPSIGWSDKLFGCSGNLRNRCAHRPSDTLSKLMDAPSVYGYKRVDSRAVRVSFLLLHLPANQATTLAQAVAFIVFSRSLWLHASWDGKVCNPPFLVTLPFFFIPKGLMFARSRGRVGFVEFQLGEDVEHA